MRLWSIHPEYLDTQGLLALWREGLLAKRVLEGKTQGYKYHPQLIRFRNYSAPIHGINAYLSHVFIEATRRGYNFDVTKIVFKANEKLIPVTSGQIKFEFEHLLKKLKLRATEKYNQLKKTEDIKPHPIFYLVNGPIDFF